MDTTVTFNEAWVTVFIGNLPFELSEKDIRSVLEQYGPVNALKLVTHRESGQSQGICFAEMNPQGADAAIDALEGREFHGRTLKVRLVQREDVEDTLPA